MNFFISNGSLVNLDNVNTIDKSEGEKLTIHFNNGEKREFAFSMRGERDKVFTNILDQITNRSSNQLIRGK